MHQFLQPLFVWYFSKLGEFGMTGVVILMAMSCSIIPVPGEMVVPPAAVAYVGDADGWFFYLRMLMVIISSTIGSYLGASLTYWGARALGRPLVIHFGKYILITEDKLKKAEHWMITYGAVGVFFGRLLPLFRHIIGIPAGIVGMRFRTFSAMILLSSLVWSVLFTVLGLLMRNDMQLVIDHHGEYANHAEQQAVEQAFSNLSWATIVIIAFLLGLYVLFVMRKPKTANHHSDVPVEVEAE